ncbi:MAG: hypothetical protein KGQ60_13090 [Planctomycetes bacterium]|nr:hypothetical protein [Planctomycetota bacterium]
MRQLLIAAFSTGWILPMWAAGSMVLQFLQSEAWPLWRGEHPANTFPFVPFASQAFAIGSVWLAAVIAWWAWRLAGLSRVAPGSIETRDVMASR